MDHMKELTATTVETSVMGKRGGTTVDLAKCSKLVFIIVQTHL
jgi:hypothetical protein